MERTTKKEVCSYDKKATDSNPSLEQWSAYQSAFDYFNSVLFEGKLPRCILNFSRHAHCYGFFAPTRWQNKELITHEISLNPDEFKRPLLNTMSTLVHEMCHLWKFEFGKKAHTPGYHCKEWAAKMVAVGLIPYNINQPEKQTGYKVTHQIVAGGRFEDAFKKIPPAYLIPWQSTPFLYAKSKRASRDKVKYICSCLCNVWGKSGLQITCNACGQRFQEQK
ncbi:SprT-like domain-containing protein [Nostoc sp. ChiQUE01b]|uniref:SprT-like domain-containing protein n=1 Tax=Nostoc sp. ChiQUE01b TaxID=3075376 RepID=UPI002AD5884C|nr:SprT-like domain-containing protein [Nostoc sp. ChiQUE01b]MDZ8260605.1 SprT-like domain-containing protein [Nostoc sp. ChiQUE01b]